MKSAAAIVHVGYPKCASTTIQHMFLARQPEALFVSRKASAGDPRYWELYEQISKALTKNKQVRNAKNAWNRATAENLGCRAFIFSDERLTLPRRHGNFTSILDRPAIVERVFPNARIILVVREPLDYLRSLYQQMGVNDYRKDGSLPIPFAEWLDQDIESSKHRRGAISQGLCFGEIAARYSEVFGKQNVGIFFLEDLKSDSCGFFESLAQFMELSEPVIPTQTSMENRNVTSEKKIMLDIADKVPCFAAPTFPQEFLDQAIPFIRLQAKYLREALNIDVWSRWKKAESSPT